jgi:hypothetical protein
MLQNFRILARKLEVKLDVQSRAINFDRQGHSLTQKKVVNIITFHHVV